MSVGYVAVQWNRHKRIYDLLVFGLVLLYLGMFFFISRLFRRPPHSLSDEVIAIRALGSCTFLMLTCVLCIGPLARLDRRFLPVLYNRRHLGVATFLIALVHGLISIGYYHGFGRINPLISLLTTNTNFLSLEAFPFQLFGLLGLVVLFLMAATSHDFWNRNLSARTWKSLHMMVYPAYFLIVVHVVLGALQSDREWWFAGMVCASPIMVAALHLAAARREHTVDSSAAAPNDANNSWLQAGSVNQLIDGRAVIVCPKDGERIAVFRNGQEVSAITNVCAHQGGPLGEGKIIEGCVTCPWHGWQYRVTDGQSPPPFTERIATHRVQIVGKQVLVDVRPQLPGTPIPPAKISETNHG